jgi:hypothetical protein
VEAVLVSTRHQLPWTGCIFSTTRQLLGAFGGGKHTSVPGTDNGAYFSLGESTSLAVAGALAYGACGQLSPLPPFPPFLTFGTSTAHLPCFSSQPALPGQPRKAVPRYINFFSASRRYHPRLDIVPVVHHIPPSIHHFWRSYEPIRIHRHLRGCVAPRIEAGWLPIPWPSG